MIFSRYITVGVAVCLMTGTAHAFQQTGQGGADKATVPEEKTLDLSTDGVSKPSGGTVVTIPGLGSLGVLPKLDFGLELLYGEAPTASAEPPSEPESDTDDLRIKGTLKHRF